MAKNTRDTSNQPPPAAKGHSRQISKRDTRNRKRIPPKVEAPPTAADNLLQGVVQAICSLNNPPVVAKTPVHGQEQSLLESVMLSRAERRYIQEMEPDKRDRILQMLNMAAPPTTPLRIRVCESKLPFNTQREIMSQLIGADCNAKMVTYVEKALSLPIGRFSPRMHMDVPVSTWIENARATMDKAMFGQHTAKDEIVRMLCKLVSSDASRPFALALQGAPGIGKTSFVQNAIAPVLNRPFSFFSLGGAADSGFLVGHSFTYEGSQCGGIANALIDQNVMDGVFFFDELDKISDTAKGHEIANMLLHLTDRAQNHQFAVDKYLGIPLDFSKTTFVFSFNDEKQINPVLLNRMNVIKFDTPSEDDKVQIAKQHLLPRALTAAGLDPDTNKSIYISDDVIRSIIQRGKKEPGVRNLEKDIGRIIDTCNVLAHNGGGSLHMIGDDMPHSISLPFKITERIAFRCIDSAFHDDLPPSNMYT